MVMRYKGGGGGGGVEFVRVTIEYDIYALGKRKEDGRLVNFHLLKYSLKEF